MRWLLPFLVACSTPSAPPDHEQALARVNGQTIAVSEVEALVRATGVTPREALHDLVSERLLASHAQPYEHAAVVEQGVQRALVQRLLALEVGEGEAKTQREKLDRLMARLTAEARLQYREATITRVFAP
ncbi:MAG TPA: hypothetical protein VFX59_15510 [Polyangiales bacterium]|nr:hypothetical protein [Polyangiales bacterium]